MLRMVVLVVAVGVLGGVILYLAINARVTPRAREQRQQEILAPGGGFGLVLKSRYLGPIESGLFTLKRSLTQERCHAVFIAKTAAWPFGEREIVGRELRVNGRPARSATQV